MKCVKQIGLLSIFFFLTACETSNKNELQRKQAAPQIDTVAAKEIQRFNREVNSPEALGIRGVYNVPEMLSVVVLDSAPADLVAQKRVEAFTKIENDIKAIGATVDGSPGSIYYTNDPNNFKFECLMLIREMPKSNPSNSKIVVLEASPMLIYNHKGSYRNLNQAYSKIRTYCDSTFLEQIGPMREFYIVSPINTTDSTSWLTRIMVPVAKSSKKI